MSKKKRRQPPAPVPAPAAGDGPQAALGTSAMARRPEFLLWTPQLYDADSAEQWEREDQRAFSRQLFTESPPARAAIRRKVEYRVGTGLRLQSRIDAQELRLTDEQAEEWQTLAEKRFHMWASSPFASVEGDQNFYEMQALIAQSRELSGDVFGILTRKERPNWPFRTAIQLIEADRVCNENNTANTSELYEGIKRAADGEIVSIFVANHHPNRVINAATNKKWSEISIYAPNGRRNIFHAKKMERPGQTRGMPSLSVCTSILKQVTRYSEAELTAAINAATQAVFARMSTDSFKDLFHDPAQQEQYINQGLQARQDAQGTDSGRILNLLPGEEVSSPTPGRPNPNFGAFVNDFYTQLGMGVNVPREVILGVFESSYTAARAQLQQFWQTIYINRASDEAQILNPIYHTFLFDSIADGIIQAPGFFSSIFIRYAWSGSQWTGMGPSSLNPLDEARAAVLLAGNITTEEEEAMKFDGGIWKTRHKQRVREMKARRRDGLPPLGATATPATEPTDDSIDDNIDDSIDDNDEDDDQSPDQQRQTP